MNDPTLNSFSPSDIASGVKATGLQTFPASDNVQEELVGLTEEEQAEQQQIEDYPNDFRGGLVPGDGIPYDADINNPPEPQSWTVKVPNTTSVLKARYFLDGSLRTFLVGQFVELGIAGQPSIVAPIQVASIGVQVVNLLSDGKFSQHRQAIVSPILVPLMPSLFPQAHAAFQSMLSLWNITRQGIPPASYYLADTLEQSQTQTSPLTPKQLMELRDFARLRSRGTGASNREMRELETWMSDQIVANELGPGSFGDELLVVDGSLMFPLRVIQRRNDWTRVVGVSKSFGFTPFVYQQGLNDKVGVNLMTSLQNLAEGERTRAFFILNHNQVAWYLRLHEQHLPTRYGGIIKVEMSSQVATNYPGYSDFGAFVNAVSEVLLNIRFPTAPRSNRWDTHLYPIYVAETSLKACMPSQQRIMNTWKYLF